jgi:hypothetical protein
MTEYAEQIECAQHIKQQIVMSKSLFELNKIDQMQIDEMIVLLRFYGWIRRVRVGGGGRFWGL